MRVSESFQRTLSHVPLMRLVVTNNNAEDHDNDKREGAAARSTMTDQVYTHAKWERHRRTMRYARHVIYMPFSKIFIALLVPVSAVMVAATVVGLYETARKRGAISSSWPRLTVGTGQPFSLTAFALSLLLVFRTNSSYDRWWEARKLWGGMLNRSRDFVRQGLSWFPDDAPQLKAQLVRHTIAFSFCLCGWLRGEVEQLGDQLKDVLTDPELLALQQSSHKVNYVLQVLSEVLRAARLPDMRAFRMDENLTFFEDVLGACERILKTPIPLSYTRHTSRFLILWLLLLPTALWEACSWTSIPISGIIAFLMLGIDEIGVQIEEPFGILPLQQICEVVKGNLTELHVKHEAVKMLITTMRDNDEGSMATLEAVPEDAMTPRPAAKRAMQQAAASAGGRTIELTVISGPADSCPNMSTARVTHQPAAALAATTTLQQSSGMHLGPSGDPGSRALPPTRSGPSAPSPPPLPGAGAAQGGVEGLIVMQDPLLAAASGPIQVDVLGPPGARRQSNGMFGGGGATAKFLDKWGTKMGIRGDGSATQAASAMLAKLTPNLAAMTGRSSPTVSSQSSAAAAASLNMNDKPSAPGGGRTSMAAMASASGACPGQGVSQQVAGQHKDDLDMMFDALDARLGRQARLEGLSSTQAAAPRAADTSSMTAALAPALAHRDSPADGRMAGAVGSASSVGSLAGAPTALVSAVTDAASGRVAGVKTIDSPRAGVRGVGQGAAHAGGSSPKATATVNVNMFAESRGSPVVMPVPAGLPKLVIKLPSNK